MIAIAIVAVAMLFTTKVKAQTVDKSAWRLGIGVEGGIPTGNAHDGSNFELGGTARLQYGIDKNLALTLTSGYYNFFGKTINETIVTPTSTTTITAKSESVGVVPVKAGLKAFFTPNLYFGAEAGVGFETVTDGNTKLILSPDVGYATKS